MTSQLNVNTIANKAGSGTVTLTKQIAAKSYVNVNGDNNPPTIRDTLNVASLTDVSAGQIFYNLTNAMSSGDYCRLVSAGDSGVRRVSDTGSPCNSKCIIPDSIFFESICLSIGGFFHASRSITIDNGSFPVTSEQ